MPFALGGLGSSAPAMWRRGKRVCVAVLGSPFSSAAALSVSASRGDRPGVWPVTPLDRRGNEAF